MLSHRGAEVRPAFVDRHVRGVYNAGLCAVACSRSVRVRRLMTAKKTAKSAKAGSRSQPAKKAKSAPGLLSRIKGALSKKPAARTTKPASRSTAAKTKPAARKSSAAAAVKKAATKSPAARSKPAVRTPAKPAAKMPAAAAKAAKPASPAKPRSAPTPAVAAPSPVSTHHVTKSPAKKSRIASFSPNLTEDDIKAMHEDDYMNEIQLEFFRRRLMQMRQEVLQREMDVKERLHEREVFADPADRATAEEEHWLDLRLRERESLLLRKIDDALRRIEAKEYGYCEKTGDPIGIPRLLARPTATVCVDVKGQDERVEAQYRDR
jgi:DnaK suppressor protein